MRIKTEALAVRDKAEIFNNRFDIATPHQSTALTASPRRGSLFRKGALTHHLAAVILPLSGRAFVVLTFKADQPKSKDILSKTNLVYMIPKYYNYIVHE
jgi:hypothetical protein